MRPLAFRLPLLFLAAVSASSLFLFIMTPPVNAACLLIPKADPEPGGLYRHLSDGCSAKERAAHAVTSEELFSTIRAGKVVDLSRVLVKGDLLLDGLPAITRDELVKRRPDLKPFLDESGVARFRIVSGPVSIRDSIVEGGVATRLRDGVLMFAGPVIMTGTTFMRPLDLSRSRFLDAVDFSHATFRNESLFVLSRFEQGARFASATFGPRGRFHKARFLSEANFVETDFRGMVEFIEVVFRKDARFARASFRLGTGFSGAHFHGAADFSETTFEREAYFRYSIFEGVADFRESTFRSTADFSAAEFRRSEDFSTAFFEREPQFAGTKTAAEARAPGGMVSPGILYVTAAALCVLAVYLLVRLKRD